MSESITCSTEEPLKLRHESVDNTGSRGHCPRGLERSLRRSNLVDGALSPGRWLSHSRLNSAPRVPGLTDKQ
ncbi:Signal recognition particle subunit SRP14 [Fusarium oxysporum f. sp. albedinis]|nr:Signal recognition particle subunit SRP14 [Fusarium oxysporum f. sp. albedinis]